MTKFDAKAGIEFARHLFNSAGTDSYPRTMIDALSRIAPFEIYTVTEFSPSRHPTFFFGNLSDFVASSVIEKFISGSYLLDAVYSAACEKVPPGLYRLSELAPDNYFSSDFYNSSDFHPCVSDDAGSLAEEIVFMANPFGETYLVISLMRRKGLSAFSSEEFAELKLVEQIVIDTAVAHWRGSIRPTGDTGEKALESTLEKAFSTFAKDKLSPREQSIVSLLLRGHSTLSVSANLDIAEGTAKVHRRNIYDKLGISSQAEMFLMFCSHAIDIK